MNSGLQSIDTHCHLQFNGYDKNREDVMKRCNQKQMILNIVGTQKDTSRAAVELAEKYDNVYATIGTHPIHLFPTNVDEEESSFVSREENFDEEFYNELAKSKKVIGVGETGLDLFHIPKDKVNGGARDGTLGYIPMDKVNGEARQGELRSKRESLGGEGALGQKVLEKQKKVFIAHINFAEKHNLPLVIHCRQAHREMIELLKIVIARSEATSQSQEQRDSYSSEELRNDKKIRGVMHCFTGNWEQARQYLDMGLYLGFTGVVTFPPKKTDPKQQNDLLEVLQKVPLDRILVETDAPYLAPQKYRGVFPSEPWMVEEVVKKIAEIRPDSALWATPGQGEKPEDIIRKITMENALRLFTGINLKKGKKGVDPAPFWQRWRIKQR